MQDLRDPGASQASASDECKDFVRLMMAARNRLPRTFYRFVVVLRESDEPVGWCDLYGDEAQPDVVELGFRIAPSVYSRSWGWSKGTLQTERQEASSVFTPHATYGGCRSPDRMEAKDMTTNDVFPQIDHLVYAVHDLEEGIEHIERLLGVRPEPGGQHLGWGTHNALLSLGPGRYLEIIAPDPDQPRPERGRAFGLDDLQSPRLVRWAAKGTDLNNFGAAALHNGIELGAVLDGSRSRPDGVLVKWQLTDPWTDPADGLIPFFIDWGDSLHPSMPLQPAATLLGLRAEHPDPERIKQMLEHLGLQLPVAQGPKTKLVAVIDGKNGLVELT